MLCDANVINVVLRCIQISKIYFRVQLKDPVQDAGALLALLLSDIMPLWPILNSQIQKANLHFEA